MPHRQLWRRCGALEHFQEKGLVGGRYVARKLAHLVYLSVEGVFVGHGEHLVGIERAAERYVAERGVEGVLARRQQPRAFHLLVVAAALYAVGRQRFEHLSDVIYVSGAGIFSLDGGEEVVRCVRGVWQRRIRRPVGVCELSLFGKVHKAHEVAALVVFAAFIGYPYLDAGDVDA